MDIKFTRMALFIAVLFSFAINCTVALAETVGDVITDPLVVADTTIHVINLMPLFQFLLPLLGVVLTVLTVAGILWLQKKLGVEKLFEKEKLHDMVDAQMDKAVAYGIQQLEKADWTKVETKNAILAGAANFMIDHADDLVDKAGMTPEKVKALLEAKLNDYDEAKGTWEQTEQK